jgi:hypothetical protein
MAADPVQAKALRVAADMYRRPEYYAALTDRIHRGVGMIGAAHDAVDEGLRLIAAMRHTPRGVIYVNRARTPLPVTRPRTVTPRRREGRAGRRTRARAGPGDPDPSEPPGPDDLDGAAVV